MYSLDVVEVKVVIWFNQYLWSTRCCENPDFLQAATFTASRLDFVARPALLVWEVSHAESGWHDGSLWQLWELCHPHDLQTQSSIFVVQLV